MGEQQSCCVAASTVVCVEKIENESALQRFARLESQMEALLKAKPSLVEHLSKRKQKKFLFKKNQINFNFSSFCFAKVKQLRDLENDVAFNDM